MSELLPPYSERPLPVATAAASSSSSAPAVPARTRIAGDVCTCSIDDMQHDYIKIIRESATSFRACLTVDMTPIYRVEIPEHSAAAMGDIVIYQAADASRTGVVAAARMIKMQEGDGESPPVAGTCADADALATKKAHWHMLRLLKGWERYCAWDYSCSIPIIAVPGSAPLKPTFKWRTTSTSPRLELWWNGPLHLESSGAYNAGWDPRLVFATCEVKKVPGHSYPTLIRIRRGGGLEFELTVVLQVFAMLQHMNKPR